MTLQVSLLSTCKSPQQWHFLYNLKQKDVKIFTLCMQSFLSIVIYICFLFQSILEGRIKQLLFFYKRYLVLLLILKSIIKSNGFVVKKWFWCKLFFPSFDFEMYKINFTSILVKVKKNQHFCVNLSLIYE